MQLGGVQQGSEFFFGPVSAAGVVVSYVWYRLVRSYRDLNSAKFKVVHEIESLLPIRPYDAEWTVLGRGKDRTKYLKVTRLESVVPWVFIALHALVLARSLPWPSP